MVSDAGCVLSVIGPNCSTVMLHSSHKRCRKSSVRAVAGMRVGGADGGAIFAACGRDVPKDRSRRRVGRVQMQGAPAEGA